MSFDVTHGKEAHARKPQVLMFDKDLDRDEVRLTEMINETTHVTVASSVDAECIRLLKT